MIRHSIALNSLDIIGFNNLSNFALYSYFSAVQMSQDKFIASECLYQGNFFFNHKISTLSLESSMRLFIDNDHYISWFKAWVFISFAMEYIFLTIWSTFVYLDFYYFLFFNYFLTIAILTFIFFPDLFTLSSAIITWTCSLSIHTWSQHLHSCLHTVSMTTITCLNCSCFTSPSFTFDTNSFSSNNNLRCLSII